MTPFLADPDFTLYVGNALDVLRELQDDSIHCVITSPPYYGLRDYGTGEWVGGDPECSHSQGKGGQGPQSKNAKAEYPAFAAHRGGNPDECPRCGARRVDQQLGLERLHDCAGWATGERCGECYVCRMTAVFSEVRRVLRDDGTFWLNIGDSYASSSTYNGPRSLHTEHDWKQDADVRPNVSAAQVGLKPKNLIGIPWRLAFSLQAEGWTLRAENIWWKPNVMPESAKDRTTRAHEHVFMFAKSRRYFFDQDAIKEDAIWDRWGAQSQVKDYTDVGRASMVSWRTKNDIEENLDTSRRNPRSVWPICTEPFPDAHFAVFPPELPMKVILAGTSEKGCCPTCAAPWERVTGRDCEKCGELVPTQAKECAACGFRNTEWRDEREVEEAKRSTDFSQPGKAVPRRRDMTPRGRVEGWQPTCKHKHTEAELVPCTVLDPFLGSGTTAVVARQLGRHSIGIELNGEYAREIVEGRTAQQGLLV